jgi:hypothetical protein
MAVDPELIAQAEEDGVNEASLLASLGVLLLLFGNTQPGPQASASAKRAALELFLNDMKGRARAIATELLEAGLTPANLVRFEGRMITEIIQVTQVGSSAIWRGGVSRIGAAETITNNIIREEVGFIRQAVADLRNGTRPFNGTVSSWSGMYGEGGKKSYYAIGTDDMANEGFTVEQNVLDLSVENCEGCITETARGVVPVGELVPLGNRSPCFSNDRCSIDRFNQVTGETVRV